jgi:hypothetical protein
MIFTKGSGKFDRIDIGTSYEDSRSVHGLVRYSHSSRLCCSCQLGSSGIVARYLPIDREPPLGTSTKRHVSPAPHDRVGVFRMA